MKSSLFFFILIHENLNEPNGNNVSHVSHALYACLCMEESIKKGGKKEIGFTESRNQASYVLIKKLIKKKLVIHLMYLVSQI